MPENINKKFKLVLIDGVYWKGESIGLDSYPYCPNCLIEMEHDSPMFGKDKYKCPECKKEVKLSAEEVRGYNKRARRDWTMAAD